MLALGAATLTMLPQDARRDAAIAKADAAVRAATSQAAAEADRPTFHYHAPAQWMNDPNGPIFYRGWYHLFYQSHPFGAGSGTKHWGHARSRDLVHWEEMPTALWPSQELGEGEIWSGTVFPVPSGRPLAFYTSIPQGKSPTTDAEQWIAVPEDDDLVRWRKDPFRLTQTAHGANTLVEWRDPFLFNDFGLPFMVTGGGRGGRGVVALYKPTGSDLRGWQYLGDAFTHPDPNVRNIECPNLFPLDGKWVLLVSVWPNVEAFVGELRNTTFVAEHRSVLAEGSYASQIFQGVEGRVVHTAWVPTEGHTGWNGFLTLPSELRVAKDGTLLRTPVRELTKLRGKAIHLEDASVSGAQPLASMPRDQVEIELTLEPSPAGRAGLRVGGVEIAYEAATGRIVVGRKSAVLASSRVGKGLRLRVYRDRAAVDVYAADGAATFVDTAPHGSLDREGVSLFAEGGNARFKAITAWRLSLDHRDPRTP